MDQQLFGTIDTQEGAAKAQVLIDRDRPNEWLVQWYGDGVTPQGLLMEVVWADATATLVPKTFFKPNAAGGLYAPNRLTDEEQRHVQGLRATMVRNGTRLIGQWTGVDDTRGNFEFHPPLAGLLVQAVELPSWAAFKAWADARRTEGKIAIYRGHGCRSFSLRTSLHRAGRYRLDRYQTEDLSQFHILAEASLDRRFDLTNPNDYSTVIALAQHHGVPSPLLDWTASPYIAAFFALSDALENLETRHSTHVRIYTLTKDFIGATSPELVRLGNPGPFVSSLQVAPIHNPRLYAQQGRFLVTNVGNLESFICGVEELIGVRHVGAVDIPVDVAADALRDLQFMGLTAATLYPGLDGIGRMLKHQMLASLPREEMPEKTAAPEPAPNVVAELAPGGQPAAVNAEVARR